MKVNAPITQCPTCGEAVWDNRGTKKSAKSPDFRCKENREHVFWLSKPSGGTNRTTPSYSWTELGLTFKKCHEMAVNIVGASPADVVQSATATLFIQATRMGLKVQPAQPKLPPPPQDYPGDEMDEPY